MGTQKNAFLIILFLESISSISEDKFFESVFLIFLAPFLVLSLATVTPKM